ncbi:MAG: hypothetical protein VB096_04860 [Pseudoflavonifractor sp.]|nr:hypothetical protein [Pseudoflavonifractor sp.]
MKKRGVAAAVTLLLFSCLALVGAYNIHQLLSRQLLFSWRIGTCLGAVFAVSAVRSWFLLLEGSAALLVAWMAFGREYIKYKSDMLRVCPGIETPKAEGQGQYGTARWMSDKERDTLFSCVRLDLDAPQLQKLLRRGYDDLEGME